jgi:hypothetical protein
VSEAKVVHEEVNIAQEAGRLITHSDGELERLDQQNKVKHRWQRAKIILWLSAIIIFAILMYSILIGVFSADPAAKDWARQTLTALMGFAAGSMWTSAQKAAEDG